ncbi:MAG TPA: hypothetical protein VM345_18840 [Acidimicrobiales bacterium]|nr:hypothetical protein [Acidimicrobiales bacterium]
MPDETQEQNGGTQERVEATGGAGPVGQPLDPDSREGDEHRGDAGYLEDAQED